MTRARSSVRTSLFQSSSEALELLFPGRAAGPRPPGPRRPAPSCPCPPRPRPAAAPGQSSAHSPPGPSVGVEARWCGAEDRGVRPHRSARHTPPWPRARAGRGAVNGNTGEIQTKSAAEPIAMDQSQLLSAGERSLVTGCEQEGRGLRGTQPFATTRRI